MRHRPLKFGKRKLLVKPTLAESKFAIVFTTVILLLFSSFYYMIFHFEDSDDILGSTDPRQNALRLESGEDDRPPHAPPLKLTSSGFADGDLIPTKYTCAAGATTVSPPLEWSNVPKDTVSFVLTVHDLEPRPPNGIDDILRRIVWNIPASATQLPGGVPVNAELSGGSRQTVGISTDDANPLYERSCSKQGAAHQYTFELFALDQKLDRAPGTTRADADLLKAMDGHIVGHAVLTGLLRE